MPRKSETQALRQIRSLYALGPVGGLSDAQLVERFLTAEGADREDAFGALVQRHGPMVLRVCRRMLAGSAESGDDAFQAVFLVLARKAASVRQVEGLKSWLYGVAVRTSKEARRRSARRRAREGGAMDESKAAPSADEGTRELLALLDEEIDRLPARFREALMLCELEGVSRQEAARQLGVPEGTLSSRLSRGRSLLRSRLARRGVALGAGALAALLPETTSAAASEPLVEATVRLSLKFAAGGSVPPALASLAEGVLAMIAVARLKLALFAIATLGAAACLTAGLAWAVGPKAEAPAVAEPAVVAAVEEKDEEAGVLRVRGVVVDEAGKPVAGAEVVVDPSHDGESRGTTSPDGSFAIAKQDGRVPGTALLARSADGNRRGSFVYRYNLTRAEEAPARIVLKPARAVVVRVTDAAGAGVPGAAVGACVSPMVLAEGTTDSQGLARLLLPPDAQVQWIFARKTGRGFDYAEFGTFDDVGRSRGTVPVSDLPASLGLKLDGARTVRIRALDRDSRPVAGVGFEPWLLRKPGRRSHFNSSSRIIRAETGPDGIATFDWLPANPQRLTFWPRSGGFVKRRVDVKEETTGTVVARLVREETIRGRVVHPDGSPARGIDVSAYGSGQGMDHGRGRAHTAADGTYVMMVSPDEAYVVCIEDDEWAARSRLDVVVRAGKPAEGVDLQLTRGTLLRGTVTVAPSNQPVANQFIRLDESSGPAPKELRQEGDTVYRAVHRQWGPLTDAAGHYSVRLGPGTYTLFGPPHTKDETITVRDEPELVRDFRMTRLERGMLTGRIVRVGAEEQGIAGAVVDGTAATFVASPFRVTADDQGRFRVERDLDSTVLFARSADGTLGAIVELSAEATEVVIAVAPTATATGVLVDEHGKPAPNLELSWGRRVYVSQEKELGPFMTCFGPKVVTDGEARFTLPSLVVGQEYDVSVRRGNSFPAAGVVRPEAATSIDLGTLRIGGYRPKPGTRGYEEAMSSFRKDAPGTGAVAPPIEATTLAGRPLTLADFRGKYVLLDFWATWCGPCLGEIPQLQAVHDAFGKDGRFAILSLSVDEKIDETREFQEKRKLPWSQAFLGAGIHGPTPGTFGVRAIPAFVLVGPDGKIVARGMRGDDIKKEVAKALRPMP